MRKMKHFLTLILSHRKLKYSEHFIPFLCESDKIFELTIKMNSIEEESENKYHEKGWLSYAKSSISNVVSSAQNIKFEKLVPQFVSYLTGSQHSEEDEDHELSRNEKRIEMLKLSFIEFYQLLSNIQKWRDEEWKIERNLAFLIDNMPTFDKIKENNVIDQLSKSIKQQADWSYENSNHLKELIYASESHLVWIESVQDLIVRTHDLYSKINEMKNKVTANQSHKNEIEIYKELITLTQKKEEMNNGVKKEIERLKIGTIDFYNRCAHIGLIMNQLEYYQNSH